MVFEPKKYFIIINVLLITAGLYFGVSAFYTIGAAWLGAPVEQPPKVSPTATSKPLAAARPLSAYSAIAQRNLFNTNPDTVAPEQTINVDNLKETDLKLKLWGTVAGEGRRAYAVIEDTKTKEQSLYRTGDSIQNATLKMILRQKVVLSVNGQDEILGMEEPGSVKRGGARPQLARQDTTPPKLPVSSYPRQLTLNSDQIESALENVDQLMEQARIRPHIEEGRPAGISITGIKPNTVFRKMRLRNGDIITGVNGAPIESVEDAMKIFGDLSSASEIQLEIKRRGRTRTLNYKIE
ncbi:MAG: PDZ domain-containing protein [Deltaproteobacteria bacterium]|jgi:general secretion pathway protein C|nr:PDZ domain-containing protein [Deltaproteobacteria bacterium]MBW2515793.1 PDZ domain-containing protein [Deltaproteobacteria bacterium]